MKPGPKPTPSHVKKLLGNPGKRPIKQGEPQYPPGAGDAPPHLDQVAREEWERISELMTATGVLTQADRAVLSLYCSAWSKWVNAETKLAGDLVLSLKNGMDGGNPYLSIANKQLEIIIRLAAILGLDPCSRTRLTSPDAAMARPRESSNIKSRPRTSFDEQVPSAD